MGLPLTDQQVRDTRAALLRHSGNFSAVARELGIARSSVQSRAAALASGRYPGEECNNKPIRYPNPLGGNDFISKNPQTDSLVNPVAKPHYRGVPWSWQKNQDDRIYKVLAVGDHHDKPGRDKTRALWIGRHAAETRPDAIVSIGDWASLDSLSTHELPGSEAEAARPAFHEDLESLHESLSVFHRGLPIGSIPVVHTHGNHEHRAWRSANRNPKSNGDMPTRLDTVFHQFRWKTHAFGEFVDIFGCDFVHCPLNVMGREMGGENVERNIGNKSLRSLVFGHTHRANVLNISKVGQQRKVTILNLGTSMPMGVVEKYNGLSQTGWSYGVFELRIQSGVILSAKHFDMLELAERYA